MPATATITGGTQTHPAMQTVTLAALSSVEVAAAQEALSHLATPYGGAPDAPIKTDITDHHNTMGEANVYNIEADGVTNLNMPTDAQGLVVYGDGDANIVAASTNELVVGNGADDTIQAFTHMAQGSGTIIVGDGDNVLKLGSGKFSIMTGDGINTFAVKGAGGSLYVSGDAASNTVVVAGSSSTTLASTGTLSVSAVGNDTITFGAGNDTVVAHGSATVYGGSGSMVFHEANDARNGDTVYAGSGNATMYGGAQASTFFGSTTGSLSVDMYAGTSGDTLVGGNGHGAEVMHGGAGVDYFEFDSVNGGGIADPSHPGHDFSHTIYGFTEGQDFIDLKGYTAADIKNEVTNHGDTIIKLTDGTEIKIMGDTSFNVATDIKYH